MLGIGIDILENKRMLKSCSEKFINEILTIEEQKIYNSKIGKNKLDFLCGRFVAKEAIIKAVNLYENPHMLEIEITNDKNGAPIVKFKNYQILLSISHEKNYTVATAILTKK